MKTIYWILGGVALYYLYTKAQENAPLIFNQISEGTGENDDQSPGIFNQAMEVFEPELQTMDDMTQQRRNAFLAVIRATEGTDQYENPYAVIFGGRELEPADYSDHPGNLGFNDWTHFNSKGKDTYSTAAGAYQFLLGTWNRLKTKLGLPDFSPTSQDLAALELIRERGALSDIDNGDVLSGTKKVATIWASLPGAPYGQPTKSEDFVLNTFNNALVS